MGQIAIDEVTLNLNSTEGLSRSRLVNVPSAARSFSVYLVAENLADAVRVRVLQGRHHLRHGTVGLCPMDPDVLLVPASGRSAAASRFHRCDPGGVMVAEVVIGQAGGDDGAMVMFVFDDEDRV